uniref:Microtubule actin crosslinking factor 1 n=1 Tax=Chrysemys picta bellii TaxID=8478 RepID=A0A8C3FQD0_CHRPI
LLTKNRRMGASNKYHSVHVWRGPSSHGSPLRCRDSRSCRSERSYRSERSGSLSPCPPGDTLPWNLPLHEQKKRKSQDSVLDPAERAVVRVADERDRVQKKTFTKWVNKHLMKVRKHINDLYEDLRDGHNLISLLEVLSGVKLPREKGRMRFHRLQNVQIALDFLKQRQVKLVNIRNDDITDGNPKLTLGLIWTIILHFQISDIYISGESGDMSAKEKLLLWTQKVTAGYVGVKCTNFSSCWSDGKMFNALIHRYRPDMVDMERVQIQSNRENLEQAFEVAERLGVTRLLDAEDVDVPSPDEKSVITYVSSIYDAFPKVPEGGDGISAIEVDSRWQEYQNRVDSLIPWIKQHTILMSDTSFPQNPVELKALYNQYIHFKETEIPTKEQEKGRIEELYKLLEVWIEFGRIKLPQGYHPNDVEEEWGKLIIEMLEREKSLRPAVERLELLLQIANKIQNGALSCEEKLTLARNTLQADAAHLESGQPVQYESDVVMYLQECEGLIRQLQVDVQILRDENYYQLEELAFRIVRLQDELVTLRLECTNLYRKGHFSTLELVQPSTLTTTHLKAEPLTKGTHTSSTSWFRKPMTRAELVAISSSEDEGNLRFVYELLSWVEEMQVGACPGLYPALQAPVLLSMLFGMANIDWAYWWLFQMKLERAEWGSDLPSVESQLETQRHVHSSVEDLGASVKEARMYEVRAHGLDSIYTETLGKLETQYCKLMETSSFRLRHLQSLYGFVSRATAELIWLNEKEEEELAYDWSDNNPNIAAKRNYFSELTMELEEKQDVFRSLQDTAELLSLENHPAKQTVEAYSAAVQSQWQWIKQLCLCVDQHVKENAAYFQFFSDARESETYLRNLQDSIKRKYSCDQNTSLTRLEDLLQDSMDEKEQLIQSKSSVASLVGRSKTIVQLKPRNPDHVLKSTISVKAVCDYRQIEITICKNDECVLEDNSQRTKWKVISPTGNEAMVPSVCFLIPPPNKEAIDIANRVEQLYQKVMALWHQLHVNTKSLISWNYLRKDIALSSVLAIKIIVVGGCQQAMKSLQAHCEDFLQDSRDSELFSGADRLRLEEEVKSSKEHFQQLLESMENEDKDETLARTYLSELKNIRLRLEECEQRLVRRIQAPSSTRTDGDTIQENTLRIAEQERVQEDLRQLKSDLQHVSERCDSFLHKSPTGSSAPHLRSELNLLVEKMDHVYGLSSIYLDKLKMVDVIVRGTQGAESLVKGYEVKLSQEEAVPADLTAIQSHRLSCCLLKQWLSDSKNKNAVFSSLDEDVAKAKVMGEQLYRLKQERSMDLERYQEKGAQLWDRWQRVGSQIETRCSDLESIQEVLRDYRECHGELIQWIEETTAQQELMKPGQAEDSRVLSEQLSQQTVREKMVTIQNPSPYTHPAFFYFQDYELQLMTYRAFVESQQKSPVKRRRMLSSSDAITQEFMDLRTRYTALVTLTTQHVKYISDALRRLEEEEVRIFYSQGITDQSLSSCSQQALNEELAARKEQVSEAIKTAQIFLAKHSHKNLIDPNTAKKISLTELMQRCIIHQETGLRLLPVKQLAGGMVSLKSGRKVSIFRAVQEGLIDRQVTVRLLEAQLFAGGIVDPRTGHRLTVDEAVRHNLIDQDMACALLIRQLQTGGIIDTVTGERLTIDEAVKRDLVASRIALVILESLWSFMGLLWPESGEILPVADALEQGILSTELAHKILSNRQLIKALFIPETTEVLTWKKAVEHGILERDVAKKLKSTVIPDVMPSMQLAGSAVRSTLSMGSAGRITLASNLDAEDETRQKLIGLQAETSGIMDPKTKEPLTIVQSVEKGLLDKGKALQLLTKQIADGGIIHHMSGMRLSVNNAMKHRLIDQDLYKELIKSENVCLHQYVHPERKELVSLPKAVSLGLINLDFHGEVQEIQALSGSIIDPVSGQRLALSKAVKEGLLSETVMEKVVLSSEMKHGIVDPESCMIIPYSEFIKKCKIDIESGQRYLELVPFRALKDKVTGDALTCAQAVKLGEVDLLPTLRVLQAQADTGGIVDGATGKRLSLRSALERDVVDEDMVRIIASNQMMAGGIVDTNSGERTVFSKQLCLEHDEKLVSYLSMLRDIEMKIKQVQPAELKLEALQNLLHQAEVRRGHCTKISPALFLSYVQELKQPLAHTKSELDATAFDIQFFISEHAQDLTPQQSRQLLRLLNELQKSFRDLSERVAAQVEVLQVCLRQVEQTDETLQEQQAMRSLKLEELCTWLGQVENTLTDQQRAADEGDLPMLQQRQSDKSCTILPYSALQEKLRLAKEQFQSLQERTEVAQKELESAVTAAVQQETEKVKAAKELEENRSKIESLLNWVTSLEQTGALSEHKARPMEQGPGALEGKSAQDILDGHLVEVDGVEENLDRQYERLKARHQELLSQQQDVILATQTAQAFLDKQGHNLAPEERQRLQGRLAELKEQYAANLSQSEKQLKQVQVLRDELQKFLRDHGEFAAWLEQAEQELERMHKGDSDPESLRPMLLRQGSFSEDVISHKGDLRFVTMSGQKVLDAERVAKEEGPEPLATGNLVKSKLDDATKRYTALHSKCAKLGSHLNTLLDRYQQFQEVAETLRSWLQESEAAVAKVLSETVSSDPAVLQKQLTNAKVRDLQPVFLQAECTSLSLSPIGHLFYPVLNSPDSIVSHFQSLSGQMAERSDLLQKSIAQSQSVQEGLENLLQSMAEIEKSLEGEQLASLSSLSKLKQDIARQKSSLEATREMVTRFMETADSATASALQGKLAEVTEHFNKLCRRQQEKENVLKGLLPKVEQYEHLSEKLQQFTESRARMLASGNQPDRDIAHFSQQIQVRSGGFVQHQEDLDTLEGLTTELSSFGFPVGSSQHQEKVHTANSLHLFTLREKDASSCQEQLDEFRKLVGTVKKWLKESEGNVPSAETSLGTQELEKRMQQIKVLLEEWTGKGAQVEEINRKGTALENLIVEITAPDAQSKTGELQPCRSEDTWNLTEIQCDMSDVNQQYEGLGMALRERQEQLSAMLEKIQEVQEEASSVLKWLESKERTLSALEASSSPTKTETMRAQAEHNKAFLAELEQNSGKIQKVKEALSGLLEKCPDSPEAANWKKMLDDLSKWARANQVTAERQQKLEKSANQLASFQAAEAQLRPWLMEKELMMSVLGPLSIDPNMLNAQKQQVQFMLKEFEARRQQHEQLNQAAQGILSSPGDGSPSSNQVREELQGVNQKWTELTERLNSRSSQIDQAIVKSTQYQELLQDLSEKVKAVGQRLSSQSAVSTQPDAVKQQLEETSEIRSDLGQLEEEIMEAQTLCDELSVLIGEQYLKDELRKRLETVALPLKADRMNRLQTALASSQQFQHMFDELRTWLDDKLCQQAQSRPISANLERLQCQIQEQEEFQKNLNQHSGSYEMIVAEGESLLLSVQPGEEKTALQSQLVGLKTHWDELSKQVTDRNSRLKDCLQKAQKYQRHMEDLLPWVEDCRAKMSELEVTLDPVQLEAALLRSKAMLSDVEKRRSLLEMLNSAADILIDACQTDEDEVRDEKAGINQKMDAITEELQAKTGCIEEMSQRLKEFQENFKNIEKKLEGATHQLEIYDALGPQACSNKNLEKLKAQQEVLQALEPQVDYLKNFTQGLVEDAPDGSDCSQLLRQAEDSQQDFKIVKQKVNECCTLMETKLEGIGQFNNHVREMFSQLADLDDELDSMGAIGRDIDSLQSQAEDVRTFLGRLQGLKSDIEASEEECRHMLEDEGSPDLLGLKRELETLNKQCSKLTERGKNRQEQVETTLSRVEDFYSKLKELNHMASAAEENEALQWIVGTEVETINQQLADFKVSMFQKEQVDPIQVKLQQVNGLGQGLIQSAGKNCDVQGLEHDMEEINARWNTLNKKVAQRIAQLQEALLHCGKFQDALEPLLSWLVDTEELISNQKPPSAEYKVVKAQIQEQKLLQRLLDDRKATVEMIQAEGGRIAQSAEPTDREKIVCHLESLENRWAGLLGKAAARQKQLEDILILAKQFHETTEPISDWLSLTEKKLANSEPIGTQTAKIQQQITRHKALAEDIESRATDVNQAVSLGQSLASLSCIAEQGLLAEKLDSLRARYSEVQDRCCRKAALLEQALSNARLFGEDEVEVLNWLAEVEDKLSLVFVKDYKRDVLQKQHADQLALNEEIVNRKKNVDQAIKNGQALLKQTTGEEVLLIQEKLDGIKTRYSDITATSSKALRTLEQARQLATKFQSTHEELTSWMSEVEEELLSSGGQSPVGEQIPQFQQRQKELKKEVMEHRLVLDTVNEVSRALLELVPWRAREGLDKLVSDTNEQYKMVSDTIRQRVDEIDAAIQRSQQYEQAADAELAWVAETKRKLMALGPIRLEQDQTTAQLQVQKAFSIDIIRHKDSMDELFSQRNEIFGTCGEEQKSLVKQYDAVSQLNSERYACLERAQALVNQFWETYEELNPWIEETQALIAQLPPPAIDHEQLKQQQEDMRQLRESIAEHKPHIDKLLKIGPQLKELNPEEGAMVQEKYLTAEAMYARIKEEVRQRALALDEAVSQSTQFHDKIEPMLETLENLSSRLRMPPVIPAEVDKIRECISENKNSTMELEKLQPTFEALKRRGEELIGRSQGADKDLAAKEIQDKLNQMVFFWEDIKAQAEGRESKFLDVLELAEKFWYEMATLLTTVKETQDIVHDLESPGIDPSIIKQQVEAAETIKEETDGVHEELEFIRVLGAELIMACGETEKPEVKKSIDEMNNAWENLNKTWKERLEKLEEAMQSAVQYQDTLQAMFDWLDNTVIKLCNMPPVGTDLNTVKEQLNEMKEFKMEVYQQQIEMEKLNHQGELMLKKATDETDRDIIREPVTELKHLWENLGEKIAHRQHKLETALLALGQFQHALAELMAWLTHTEELLDAQKPINGDPRVIEVELAKHHVLKNDVLAHQATVETVNKAGNELLESSAGDDASSLRNRLEKLNSCWESVLQKTEEREQQLQSTLQQAQGFHGEIEDFLLWLTRMESQLSASKPTGGLPETAREQLNAHMVKISNASNSTNFSPKCQHRNMSTEQSVTLLEQKWNLVSTKMEERKSKLEDALNQATEFQNSLQDFINWLTLAEQSLNIAPPPSLILNTVLSQIDEHKVFANEVNAHRDQIIELDQTGNQLKFLSQKQDVVLIKNLLVSVQSRWEKVVQRSVDRGRALDDARKRAKQFHEAWKKLVDWLEDAENHLDSELEISNDPDKIKLQLSKHKEFQKTLGGKQPVYDTTIRTGRALKEKAVLPDDTQKLDNLLGEVRDKWDTVCGKSVERQHKLEEALLFSGQFMDALQALVDWLYKVEPQLAEDQPVHGDLDLVMNLMDAHKVFQKELGKRTGTVQVLKRSGRELIENSRDDTTWVKGQLQELSNRWDTVCKLSVSKQTRLEQALKQAEEFRAAVHMLLEWLSEAEQTLRFRGALPDDAEALQSLIDIHKEFMKKVEEKRVDVNAAVGMGEVILAACHPDCITTIKHWITIIRARFEEVLTWAQQHQQRLETALSELVANAELLEELLAWIQWAETTLIQRDQEPTPQNIDQVKALISEHQSFMEEMTRKQPDVDRVTKTYKRKATEPAHGPFIEKSRSNSMFANYFLSQSETKNPRINQLSARWQQVWLLALERQRKLNDALDRLEELKEFANFDFDIWRKKYMRWMNHKKSRVMDFFRRIDKDQDGKITRQEFIDGILASKFPTTKLEMTAVADIFDRDGDGYIDYYEFVAALHPNKDAYRPTTDADKIEDEVTRQVAQCKCAKRFQVEQIGENKYRFFLGNQFGDSQQLRLVRILRSTVMVRVGGGWMALDEFLVKNDPCRVHHPGSKIKRSDSSSSIAIVLFPLSARGRTNLELREKFILPEGASQGMTPFRSRGRRSKPSSRAASPTRSSSSASQSNHSCTSMPSSPAAPASGTKTPHHFSRCYDKPWLVNSKAGTPHRGFDNSDSHLSSSEVEYGSASQRTCSKKGMRLIPFSAECFSYIIAALVSPANAKTVASRPTSRAGSRAGSRASSRRGSDASDFDLLETQSACSDTSESSTAGGQGSSRRGLAKPSKIPTMSKKTTTATPKTPGPKR